MSYNKILYVETYVGATGGVPVKPARMGQNIKSILSGRRLQFYAQGNGRDGTMNGSAEKAAHAPAGRSGEVRRLLVSLENLLRLFGGSCGGSRQGR